MENEFVFFYGGPFSQWCESFFTIDGVKYNCAEQYMMAEKSRLFKDDETLDKIMDTSNPYDMKMVYGRNVKNFDVEIWQKHCRDIVYRGNYAKFTQNEDLKRDLLSTGNKEIVEASPTDTIWGIGMGEYEIPFIYDKKNWCGSNWLGIAIMQVRDKIRKDENA